MIYDAKGFYEGKKGVEILERYDIDYVISDMGNSLGMYTITEKSKMIDLSRYSELKLIKKFNRIKIFEVKK